MISKFKIQIHLFKNFTSFSKLLNLVYIFLYPCQQIVNKSSKLKSKINKNLKRTVILIFVFIVGSLYFLYTQRFKVSISILLNWNDQLTSSQRKKLKAKLFFIDWCKWITFLFVVTQSIGLQLCRNR